MHSWFWLAGAIIFEVFATSMLKLKGALPVVLTTAGYVCSFYCLSQSLRTIPIGVAYAVWSGVGIVVISLVGYFAYRQSLPPAAILGLGLIIVGVAVVNLSAGH